MNALIDQIDSVMPTAITGSVVRTEGMMAAVAGFPAPVGAVAEIERQAGPPMLGEVVGFRDALTLVFPYEALSGVRRGNQVRMRRTSRFLRVGDQLLGRVIDAHGVIYIGAGFLSAFRHKLEVLVGAVGHEVGHRPKRWSAYKVRRELTQTEIEYFARHEETRADSCAGTGLAVLGFDCGPRFQERWEPASGRCSPPG